MDPAAHKLSQAPSTSSITHHASMYSDIPRRGRKAQLGPSTSDTGCASPGYFATRTPPISAPTTVLRVTDWHGISTPTYLCVRGGPSCFFILLKSGSSPCASSHSHTTITIHPCCRREVLFSISRRWLRSSFSFQYSALLFGIRPA